MVFIMHSMRNVIQTFNGKHVLERQSKLFVAYISSSASLNTRKPRFIRRKLPIDTALDKQDHLLSVRSPEFKGANPKISRREWRNQIAELQKVREDPELERLARTRQLLVDVEQVQREWQAAHGFDELKKLCNFYQIDRDLFGGSIDPKLWLDVSFGNVKVCRGNTIQPNLTCEVPAVNYDCDPGGLHSLIFVNLDGHPLEEEKEIIHWAVANVSGNDISTGDTVVSYLPAVPWKGTGFHRFVFALLEQKTRVDVSDLMLFDTDCLAGRTFSMLEDLRDEQDLLTPVGVCWFQSEWDSSVNASCQLLDDLAEEPIFDWEAYIEPKQEKEILKTQYSELRYRNM